MRILYFAKDAPFVLSGYGKCCREITTRLSRLGHDVAIFATVGNQSASLFEYNGIKIYPGCQDSMGEDVCLNHYEDFKADVYITQIDIWPLRNLHHLSRQGAINWIPYAPLDSFPLPLSFIEKLKYATQTVTMCHWAEKQLSNYGVQATTIHHGVDCSIYKPLRNRETFKVELGFKPNTFLIGMVQANQFMRKALEEQFRGIRIFRDAHPEIDVGVYFHTFPNRAESFVLPDLAKLVGIDDIVKFPSDYSCVLGTTEERLAQIYNAFDILLSATNGEGFGLPVIESQSCGVPVLATDCMSFPELVNYGELCKVKASFTVPAMLTKFIPDEFDMAEKLWKMYNTNYNRREIAEMARYRWDWDSRIINQWMTMLDRVREKIGVQCFTVPKRAGMLRTLEGKSCEF